MTYRPMRFDPAYRPFIRPECIYLLPLSAQPDPYRVLCTASLGKKLLDLAVQNKLAILIYADCPAEAETTIRAELLRLCFGEPKRYGSRLNQLVVAGSALAAVGLINWIFPDPIPLADEMLMTVGGAGLACLGWVQRRRNLPLLRAKAAAASRGLEALKPLVDVFLSRIYKAIRSRSCPDIFGRDSGEVDPVAAESSWLVEHLDLREALERGEGTRSELGRLVGVLEDALPLRRIAAAQRRLGHNPADRRARKALYTLAGRLGMSRDALTVYSEFYRQAREILAE